MSKGKLVVTALSISFFLITTYIIPRLDIDPSLKDVLSAFDTSKNPPISSDITVTRVIDGDTIQISTGEKVRLIGIDTPETVDPRKKVQCFGKAASDHTKEVLLNKKIRMEKDVSETDRYGRLLRYVYVDDHFINEELVRDGFARVYSYPPDVKYIPLFQIAETNARLEKKGLWKECNVN